MPEAPMIDDTISKPVDAKQPAKIAFDKILFRQDLDIVMNLVDNELSEPYSIFTYRYFLQQWPNLCWLAFDGQHCFGVVVCKAEDHKGLMRGYIAMLVVTNQYRGLGVGLELVKKCIQQMIEDQADEVVLEAEITNQQALSLYQKLGFVRDKRLHRYYLTGSDAFRLKLMLPLSPERQKKLEEEQKAMQALSGMHLANATDHSNSVKTSSSGQHRESPSAEQVIAHGIPEAVIETHLQSQEASTVGGNTGQGVSRQNCEGPNSSPSRSEPNSLGADNSRSVGSATIESPDGVQKASQGPKLPANRSRKKQNRSQRYS